MENGKRLQRMERPADRRSGGQILPMALVKKFGTGIVVTILVVIAINKFLKPRFPTLFA